MTRIGLAVFVVSLLTNGNVHATFYSLNSRLDTAIESADLVITGRISNIRQPDQLLFGGSYPDMQFKVDQVLVGKRELEGRLIEFPELSLSWPHQLVPFKKGSYCILLLLDRGPEPKELDELSKLLHLPWQRYRPTVVPARRRRFARLDGVKAIRRFLATEILAELKHETSLQRQRSLIHQVSSIVSRQECVELMPFIKSKNEWVRRSALAAVVYSTNDDKYVRMAADDINGFFRHTQPRPLIEDPALGAGEYAPYPQFFDSYWYLPCNEGHNDQIRREALSRLHKLVGHKNSTKSNSVVPPRTDDTQK